MYLEVRGLNPTVAKLCPPVLVDTVYCYAKIIKEWLHSDMTQQNYLSDHVYINHCSCIFQNSVGSQMSLSEFLHRPVHHFQDLCGVLTAIHDATPSPSQERRVFYTVVQGRLWVCFLCNVSNCTLFLNMCMSIFTVPKFQ